MGDICDYYPYVRGEISKGIYDLCEGCYCEEAKYNYVIENDLDYEE